MNIPSDAAAKAKAIVERATLFRLTSAALLNVWPIFSLPSPVSENFFFLTGFEGIRYNGSVGGETMAEDAWT